MNKSEYIGISSRKLGVLYLGNRGGGASVSESFCRELAEANYKITMFLNKKNEILPKFKKLSSDGVIELDSPENILQFINPISYIKYLLRVMRGLKCRSIKSVLIPMHHPYTILIIPFLRVFGIKVISGIHDFTPHEGGKRFLNFANALIVFFSSNVIFFSKNQINEASSQFPLLKRKFIKVGLANDFQRSDSFVKPLKPSNDYIFFGRLEPYKGIARLKEAWELVIKQNPDATLLIRGMGPNSDELRALDNMPGVDCEIGYVENNMVENLMRDVKVIVAPYDSATQSGVTGIAATFGMLAVATPCEGFIEQAKYNSRIIVVDDFSPASFAISMLEARKAWDWNSIHEDLIISTGFVDKLFDV